MNKIQKILNNHRIKKRLDKIIPENSELAASEELRKTWNQWLNENKEYKNLAASLKNLLSIDEKEKRLLRIKSINDRMLAIEDRIIQIRKNLKKRR